VQSIYAATLNRFSLDTSSRHGLHFEAQLGAGVAMRQGLLARSILLAFAASHAAPPAAATVAKVQSLIAADDLTIHIKLSDKSTERMIVPELGVGGQAVGTDTVWIYIQPENPNFKTASVGRGLPHEIHHTIRLRTQNWRWSLLESFVMEGLADHFVVEIAGGEPGPWARALTDEEIQRNLLRVKALLRAKVASYPEFVEKYEMPWLVGRSGDDPIPRNTGYTLGWRIAENYLRAHPDARASSLVQTSSEVIAGATPEILDGTR